MLFLDNRNYAVSKIIMVSKRERFLPSNVQDRQLYGHLSMQAVMRACLRKT